VRILLADDHRVVREGVRALLEQAGFQVVAEADDGEQAVRLARSHQVDVAILDIEMPGIDGIECARQILLTNPAIGIVLLTVWSDEEHVIAALRAGVRGYVVKTQASSELVDAVREVAVGATCLGKTASNVLVNLTVAGNGASDTLTPRLREVLRLIADGNTTKEIAAILGVSEKTAELYRARLMSKLDIHDTAGLVRYAIYRGLVSL
jgi:DNA-binding NarL/FixJ family response regulator